MAILGNNTDGGASFSASAGRKISSRFNVAAGGQTLQELHALVNPGSGAGNTYVIHAYAETSAAPGALVAYTSPIVLSGSGATVEISQTGLSAALSAGNYWLGVTFTTNQGNCRCFNSGGTLLAILGGATVSPPSDPYGAWDFSGVNILSVWAVTVAAAAPVADFTGTPLTGSAPLSVAFTDSSSNTPTSWAWTFGDGTTSTSQNPSHSYTSSGVYTVTLTATNATGSDTKTRTGYVSVTEPIVYVAGGGIEIY